MAKKVNSYLARRDAVLYANYRRQLNMALQMCADGALMAAADVFQCGPGRGEKFINAMKQYVNEIADLIVEDGEDDPDIVYSKDKLDRRIKQIIGAEAFAPWEERYVKDWR